MSLADLPKAYDPQDAQRRWYGFWVEKGYFHADPSSAKPPYAIVIPPPNVTGALHLGHALNNTLQDILIRWRRMQGYEALWMPGTDHAGIATQAVVERRLLEEEKKTRHDIGREALVERIWAWKDEYEARILSQLRSMGCACDWERTRFTLDEACSKAVRQTFFNLFKAGKIFRGKRLVNWDTQLRTAVADDEIYTEDVPGHIWTIRYPVSGSTTGAVLHVATTRPETMLGDTAVAVHPDDERYRHLIGKTVDLPLTGRQIPVVGDGVLVDPAFGTGCVKVTPAHDPNDYQAGLRNNLPMINLLNPDGTYNENAGAKYAGLDRSVVRKRVLQDLKDGGFLERTDPHLVPLKHSDRSKTPIEPYLSDQWFVRMADDPDGSPGFAQQAIDAVASGRVRIHPERYARSYADWLAEKRDWCISRQLWWGHRIPVWRLDNPGELGGRLRDRKAGSDADPETREEVAYRIEDDVAYACLKDPERQADIVRGLEDQGFVRDPDVLDTWFSSALWPHSTLGWPDDTPELRKFYPTSVLSTARDIITLWVARMVIFGQFNTGDVPFCDVYIHPVILDGHGVRMSKSKGNGVDPVDIIDLYGADALRFALASLATETQDIRLPVEKVKLSDGRTVNSSERFEQARPFANKFWNAARLALSNLEDFDIDQVPADVTYATPEDFWILGRLKRTAEEVTAGLESFQFAEVARSLREFTWNDFCDWYLEMVKPRLRSDDPQTRVVAQNAAVMVLDGLCRLLHPVMPFVTEQVWQALNRVAPRRLDPATLAPRAAADSVCVAPWPVYHDRLESTPVGESVVAQWQEKVRVLRNLRAERGVPKQALIDPVIVATGAVETALLAGAHHIKALAGAASLRVVGSFDRPADSAVAVLADAEVVLPLAGLIDTEAEQARNRKALADIDKQLPGLRAKLANESFLRNAPAAVVEQTRARLDELLAQRTSVASLLGEG